MEHNVNRHRVTRAWIAVLSTVLVAGVLFAAPGRGDASPSVDRRTPAPAQATGAVAQRLDPTGVEAYWSTDRMEAAVPLVLDALGKLIGAQPKATRPTATRASLRTPRSTGKLFFTTPQGDAVCSAASVNTAEKNVIITAAHCAYGKGGFLQSSAYYRNFLFVPRYNNGSAPDGAWVGTRATTHRQWIQSEDLEYDQALIEVAPRGGRNLVSVIGGNGLAWNYPAREAGVSLWGWPAESPYNGETARTCAGSTADLDGSGDAYIRCPLNGGASGGPWFLGMVNANVGFIWAVTSRRTCDEGAAINCGTSDDPYLLAHPLGSSITTLLATARGGGVAARTAPRAAVRAGIAFRAVQPRVGRGQVLTLRARTSRGVRIVLEGRVSTRRAWHRVAVARTDRSGVVVFNKRLATAGLRFYRVRTARGASATARVRVYACPLPANRSASVVKATRCTAPAG